MASLKIGNPGEIRLLINDDESKVLAFNPEDVSFANRFYEVYEYLNTRQAHYEQMDAEINALPDDAQDDHGFELKGLRRLQGQLEMCADMRKAIDTLFGEGTSQMVFGDVNVPSQFMQLLEGVMPYLTKARAKKSEKYKKAHGGGVMT